MPESAVEILELIFAKNIVLGASISLDASVRIREEIDQLVLRLAEYSALDAELYRGIADRVTLLELEYFPWQLLKPKASKLIVSYNFPPYADASSITVAKRLRESAERVDVLTQDMAGIRRSDSSLNDIVLPYVRDIYRSKQKTSFSDWKSIVGFTSWGLRKVEKIYKSSGNQYEELYSRSMFPASHFLAAAIKIRFPAVRWTAEFSDPLRHGTDGQERVHKQIPFDRAAMHYLNAVGGYFRSEMTKNRNPFAWCEFLPYALADKIVFTNFNQLTAMTDALDDVGFKKSVIEKSVVAHHPTLPTSFYRKGKSAISPTPGVLHLGYFGEFYANRGLNDVFTAIAGLANLQRDMVKLHIFTSNSQQCAESAKRFGIMENILIHPSLKLTDFLATTNEFDVLVVNDVQASPSYVRNPYLPSKYSDYKGSSADVWAIVQPGSTLDSEDVKYKSTQNDSAEARNVLVMILNEKSASS